jgi:mediator of RNA polymerase II transcription subunit 12, fungi type
LLINIGPADFFPWIGNHPEDILSENSIKSGFYDKPLAQNESGSAQRSIWSSIKNKSGLETLSTLYISALQQRQKYGIVAPKSTFKLPPRATVTEPRREVWLKNLADSDIPLRQLSRSIPHGIRGKALLDQCLSKRIPPWRALWFSKCVGANEIRAFKRKGTGAFASGGEGKWIRDWTVSVEQFLESLIEQCGTPDWRNNILYGLQLVAYIYAERLLDQEHFLDWITTSLQSSTTQNLPMWLLMIQMYWDELPIYRKRGKILALALSEQALRLDRVEANATLWEKLSNRIITFMEAHPACFFLPDQWPKYAFILQEICGDSSTFENIQQRNESMGQFGCMSCVVDCQQQILDILDNNDYRIDIRKLSRKCLAVTDNFHLLISITLQWATTVYRPNISNIYLGVRLLRRWSRLGFHLDSAVFSFLRDGPKQYGTERSKVFKIVSELIRSKHISTTRLLQWIMAQDIIEEFEFDLLSNIPLYSLPEHALNLRNIILGSKVPTSDNLDPVKALTRRLFTSHVDLPYQSLNTLSSCAKFELAHWLRGILLLHASDESLDNCDLHSLCRVFETIEDFPVLADVLGIFADMGDISLLTFILDTTNHHFDNLHAIGATENILDTVLQRMQHVTARTPTQKPLIMSLVDLVRRLPKRQKTLAILEKELILCEPKSALAACSPVSDIGEYQSDASFYEEVEMLFSSGTSMERPVISRIFTDIVKRLEASWTDVSSSANFADLLARLKSFDYELFEKLLLSWLGKILAREGIKNILTILVCSGLVQLRMIFERLVTQINDTKNLPANTLVELLDLLLEKCDIPRGYRCSSQVESMITKEPKLMASFLKIVVTRSKEVTSKSRLSDFVRRLCSVKVVSLPIPLLDMALYIDREEAFLRDLPNTINYFNIGLFQIKLQSLGKGKFDVRLAQAIIKKASTSTHSCPGLWQRLLECLPKAIPLEAHALACSTIFSTDGYDHQGLVNVLGSVEKCLHPEEMISSISNLMEHVSRFQSQLHKSSQDMPIDSISKTR